MKEFIEKLIGRLEEEKKQAQCEGSLSFAMGFKVAILIVNELAEEYNNDFCEWKPYKSEFYSYKSKCNALFPRKCGDEYEFCPYCGKKIKVVK